VMGTVLAGFWAGANSEGGFFSFAVTGLVVVLLALCNRPMRREAMAPEATTRIQRGKRIVKPYTFARAVAK